MDVGGQHILKDIDVVNASSSLKFLVRVGVKCKNKRKSNKSFTKKLKKNQKCRMSEIGMLRCGDWGTVVLVNGGKKSK